MKRNPVEEDWIDDDPDARFEAADGERPACQWVLSSIPSFDRHPITLTGNVDWPASVESTAENPQTPVFGRHHGRHGCHAAAHAAGSQICVCDGDDLAEGLA